MKVTHFMYVPFTGLGLRSGYRGDAWLKKRVAVFKQYVVASLIAQSNQNYVLWVSWRPEERNNPIVQELRAFLDSMRGMRVVFTFGGVCFYDDKYGVEEACRRLSASLTWSLPALKEYVGDSDYVLMTIQPSDDMYLSDVVETLQRYAYKKNRAVGFTKGYIMDYSNKEVAEYNPDTTPPFFTLMFPPDVFLDPEKHFNYTGPYASHEYLKDEMNLEMVDIRAFVVGTHGENISTTYQHPYKGRVLTEGERDSILISTGTYFTDVIIQRKGLRLYARNILNALPFERTLRSLYHSLPNRLQIL